MQDRLVLCSGDGLVLQDAYHYAAILGLDRGGLIRSADLAALAHRAGRQHIGQRDVPLLQQNARDAIGPVFTQPLVQSGVTGGRGVSFDLDHVAIDSLGLFRERDQRLVVLGIDVGLAVGEQDSDFVDDVVVVELAESSRILSDGGLVGGDLLLLFGQRRVLRREFSGMLFQLR